MRDIVFERGPVPLLNDWRPSRARRAYEQLRVERRTGGGERVGGRHSVASERVELQQRFLDQPVDKRALCQTSVLFLAHRGSHDRCDVESAHRLREAKHEPREILPELTGGRVPLVAVRGECSVNDAL